MSSNNPVYFRKGDNSASQDNHAIRIRLKNPEMQNRLSKVEFVVGCIVKPFVNPVFPIDIDFDETESQKLNYVNEGYLVTYDLKGRRLTAKGSIRFTIKNGVICQC